VLIARNRAEGATPTAARGEAERRLELVGATRWMRATWPMVIHGAMASCRWLNTRETCRAAPTNCIVANSTATTIAAISSHRCQRGREEKDEAGCDSMTPL